MYRSTPDIQPGMVGVQIEEPLDLDAVGGPGFNEVRHFVDCILEDRTPWSNLADAVITMKLCEAIRSGHKRHAGAVGGPPAMPMKLSVSMRVAEDMSDKRKAAMSLEDMARMAKDSGFHAVCMRAVAGRDAYAVCGRQEEARVPGLAWSRGLHGNGRLPHP